MVTIMFYVMAAIALGSALYVAASGNLIRSIFMFFITLFALAGLYVLSLADFVAVTQVVVYVGGILVLIMFAFMLSGRENLEGIKQQKNRLLSVSKLPAILLAAAFFVVLANIFLKARSDDSGWIRQAIAEQNVMTPQNISINTNYLLPFEAISILLLMALVGAAHLSRKEDSAI
jgi:NADH:ubiquinone oxidoreductase subunit 6 (subunit J)